MSGSWRHVSACLADLTSCFRQCGYWGGWWTVAERQFRPGTTTGAQAACTWRAATCGVLPCQHHLYRS
jgi:hypothetical protein